MTNRVIAHRTAEAVNEIRGMIKSHALLNRYKIIKTDVLSENEILKIIKKTSKKYELKSEHLKTILES